MPASRRRRRSSAASTSTSVAMRLHDVYVEVTGPSATDVRHNFVERWNEASDRHASDGNWCCDGSDETALCRPASAPARAEHRADPAHARCAPLSAGARRAVDPGAVPARDRCRAPHDLPAEPGDPHAGGRPPLWWRLSSAASTIVMLVPPVPEGLRFRCAPRSERGLALLGHRGAGASCQLHAGGTRRDARGQARAPPTCTPR